MPTQAFSRTVFTAADTGAQTTATRSCLTEEQIMQLSGCIANPATLGCNQIPPALFGLPACTPTAGPDIPPCLEPGSFERQMQDYCGSYPGGSGGPDPYKNALCWVSSKHPPWNQKFAAAKECGAGEEEKQGTKKAVMVGGILLLVAVGGYVVYRTTRKGKRK